jgi:CheY-like chemotaxis protein
VSDSLTLIQDQARRIGRMVDDLLTFAGSRSPHLETTNINALIQRMLQVQPSFQPDSIQIESDLALDLPTTQADPDQLNQAFVNLMHNAVQAMGAGRHPTERANSPGRLVIKTTLVRESDRKEPRIQIRFADNGPGIPPDVMPHIFEPFYTTKKCGKGTGLGLSICERIAQEHDGRIWAENNKDGGATFVLELPVIEPGEEERPTSEETLHKPLSSLRTDHRILVVDDEPGMAYGVEQILRQAGFWVTVATNGRQALSMLEKAQFDLIISDLNMPGLNGQQFYQRVADGYPHLASRIIFSTGDSGGRRLRSFLENSGSTCIGKPFKADELLHLVRKALQAN